MFFLIRWTCPAHEQAELMEMWNRMCPPQPYETRFGTYNGFDSEHGSWPCSVVEVEDGRESEWVKETVKSLGRYATIAGYIAQLDIADEAPDPTG